MGDLVILYERLGSMNFVYIDASGLTRDERKFILTRCGSGCQIQLRGTPGEVMMTKGLVASGIVK